MIKSFIFWALLASLNLDGQTLAAQCILKMRIDEAIQDIQEPESKNISDDTKGDRTVRAVKLKL